MTETSDERNHVLAQATLALAKAAMAEDGDQIAEVVDGIGDRYGERGVFCLAVGLAELVVQTNRMREVGAAQAKAAGAPEGGWWGVEFQGDEGRVEPENLFGVAETDDDLIHEKAVIFVGRFLTACLNHDQTIAVSLFFASIQAQDDMQTIANMWHLCGMAGAMLRAAEKTDLDQSWAKWEEDFGGQTDA